MEPRDVQGEGIPYLRRDLSRDHCREHGVHELIWRHVGQLQGLPQSPVHDLGGEGAGPPCVRAGEQGRALLALFEHEARHRASGGLRLCLSLGDYERRREGGHGVHEARARVESHDSMPYFGRSVMGSTAPCSRSLEGEHYGSRERESDVRATDRDPIW